MRIDRSVQICPYRGQYFHVVSRVVDRRLVFGDEEKGSFLRILRQQEDFSGIEILSYCLMGNHFHLLLHIPVRPGEISEEEVRRRMGSIYSKEKMTEYEEMIKEWEEMGQAHRIEAFYDGMRQRMYDLSHYVKETKLKFSKWYNAKNQRKGTLWEERFRSVILEGDQQSLKTVSAYIELNPLRAGIVKDPEAYPWCSYTEAVAGGKKARSGMIRIMSGQGPDIPWKRAHASYRENFLSRREIPDIGGQEVRTSAGESGLSIAKKFLVRVRYFTAGFMIGSEGFIADFYAAKRSQLHINRKKSGYKMKGSGWGGLYVYRNVRDKLEEV